jgi:2,3-dimethylmalate lyase
MKAITSTASALMFALIVIVSGEATAQTRPNGGRTPMLSADRLKALGFSIAIYPAIGFLSAGEALRRAYADLKQNGTTTSAVPMYSFSDFNKLIGFEDVWEFERRYAELD